ncbi:MAG: hypothetical protein ABEJ31_14930 [Haloarculaceae archaeon]
MIDSDRFGDRRRLVLGVGLALLVALSGCNASTGPGGTNDTGQTLQERTLAAMNDVSTVQYRMHMNVSGSGTPIEMTATGRLNRTAERLAQRVRVDLLGRSVEQAQYVDGQTMYMQLGDQWMAQNVTEGDVWNSTPVTQQRQLLAGSNVTIEGNATVNGTAVTVFRISPDPANLTQVLQDSQYSSDQYGGVDGDVGYRNVTYLLYVSQDTARLRKVAMNGTVTQRGTTSRVSMTMAFWGFDEPTEITVPEAARDASDMSGLFSGAVNGSA